MYNAQKLYKLSFFTDSNYDLFNYNQSIAGLILIFCTPRTFDKRLFLVCLFVVFYGL